MGNEPSGSTESESKGKPTKTRGQVIGGLVLFGVILFILVTCLGPSKEEKPATTTVKTPTEVVYNSSWDGSVQQVDSWLRANLKDPHSLEYIEWSPVEKRAGGGFMVRVKYRAKNSFGGYVVDNKVFVLDSSGAVTTSFDWSP
jgi:hypothetical protein